jgi:hypothetical protein
MVTANNNVKGDTCSNDIFGRKIGFKFAVIACFDNYYATSRQILISSNLLVSKNTCVSMATGEVLQI